MRIEYINEFTILARFRSFTSAAKALYLSQPTLTAHVNAMERELGVKLIDRSHQQIELTPVGRVFLHHGQKILAEYDVMMERVGKMKHSHPAKVRLSGFTEHRYVSKILNVTERLLRESDTNVSMDARNILASDPFLSLENGDLDCVICLDNFGTAPKGFLVEELQNDPLCAIVPAASPLAKREVLSVADLERITLFVPGLPDNKWMKTFTDEKLAELGLNADTSEIYFDSIHSLYSFSFRDGIYIDSQRATEHLLTPDYRVIPFKEPEMMLKEVAVFRSDADEAVYTVIEKLREAIAYLEKRSDA